MTKDSVVLISNRQFVGGTLRTVGTGSGFVYRVRENIAYVVTNNHVIENAVEVRVTFLDGTTFTTHLKWGDVYTDLAVIEIFNIPETMNLKPLLIGNSTELKVGETVYAIGNPFGLEGSMTQGIVSQLGRSLPTATGYSIVDVIQFDAAVNPGNSGGPLLNNLGMVVGVTTAIETETGGFMGIGYAVSSELLERVVPSLIENGYYKHPWVGIEGVDMNIDIAKEMETDYTYGFLVIRVIENSPAEEAGLQGGTRSVWIEGQEIIIGGDIIIGVDNRTVRKADDILTYLERYKSPGDKIVLTIVRNNEVITIDLTLGVRK
jgi:S1-C subfamily serine protease